MTVVTIRKVSIIRAVAGALADCPLAKRFKAALEPQSHPAPGIGPQSPPVGNPRTTAVSPLSASLPPSYHDFLTGASSTSFPTLPSLTPCPSSFPTTPFASPAAAINRQVCASAPSPCSPLTRTWELTSSLLHVDAHTSLRHVMARP